MGAIDDPARIYWDVRPSAKFDTVEFRVADANLTVDETVMTAGLVRGIVVACHRQAVDGEPWADPRMELRRAAMWRAARFGLDGRPRGPERMPLAAGGGDGRPPARLRPSRTRRLRATGSGSRDWWAGAGRGDGRRPPTPGLRTTVTAWRTWSTSSWRRRAGPPRPPAPGDPGCCHYRRVGWLRPCDRRDRTQVLAGLQGRRVTVLGGLRIMTSVHGPAVRGRQGRHGMGPRPLPLHRGRGRPGSRTWLPMAEVFVVTDPDTGATLGGPWR